MTRDPDRIKRIAVLLEEVWAARPHNRLGQLLINMLGPELRDLFYIEDDEWEHLLQIQAKALQPRSDK